MPEPISLLDLRRRTKTYNLDNDTQLELRGLSAREIGDHLERFGALRVISMGGSMGQLEMVASAPDVTAAWVASACGRHKDPAAEEVAVTVLTIEQLSEIAEQSLALTFSKGFGPFSARLVALLEYVTVTHGRGRDTRSGPSSPPAPPKPSSTPTTQSGTAPPDSSPPPPSSIPDATSPTPPA